MEAQDNALLRGNIESISQLSKCLWTNVPKQTIQFEEYQNPV